MLILSKGTSISDEGTEMTQKNWLLEGKIGCRMGMSKIVKNRRT